MSYTRTQLLIALLAVYIIWGSTYLFIHFMTEKMPPLLMSGIRNFVAGGLLYMVARVRPGGSTPTLPNWKAAALLGFLLLAVANGGMAIALRTIPSGIGALLVAMLPIWIVVLNWVAFGRQRPGLPVVVGLLVGLVGFFVLVGPGKFSSDAPLNWVGVGIIVVGVMCWGLGTLLAPRLPLHPSQLQATAMQMFSGGVILLVVSLLYERPSADALQYFTPKVGWSLTYLIVCGSWMGFTSYAWLAKHAPPHITATYAYVNPVVALLLGWAFADEQLTTQSLVAAGIILAGVVIIISNRKKSTATASR